ncbi:MAG: putative TIM-barrel fold metal-dependent hydrolase [Alphaproteobacteria bacterium]|jgi:predicted TIM-barrel fold metal-dependent hydrolase
MEIPTSDRYHKMSVDSFNTEKLLVNAARQRDARNFNDFPIIDADAHQYESESFSEVIEYLEDDVLHQLATAAPSILGGARGGYQPIGGRVMRYPLRKIEETPSDGVHRDIHLSRRFMDAIGMDYIGLFPTGMLSVGLMPQADLEVAYSRAYTKWLIERVLPHDDRVKGFVYLPFNTPEMAYQAVLDFGDAPGIMGFVITSPRYKPIHDNAYMKTYALIEEMGKPLTFHSGLNWNDPLMSVTNRFISAHALGFTLYNVIHMCNWITNGLSERFPKLDVVWTESGLAWVPWLGQRLDNDYKMRTSECPSLKKLPSEYMKDMYYTSQPMEKPNDLSFLESTFKFINAETQLLYASDYPHWDMDLPSTIYDLPFLSEEAKRNILGGNAIRIFDIDVSDRFPDYHKKVA